MTDTPIPAKYVIHYRFVQCSHCGHATRESEFFALTYIHSRNGTGLVKELKPVARPYYNLPVEKILTGCHKIPFCQACDHVDLSHLPPPPEPTKVRTITEPAPKAPSRPAATAAKPQRRPSIFDLA